MKELIMSLVMLVSPEVGIDFELNYRALPDNHKATAQHAYGAKSGSHYILVNEKRMDDESPRTQKNIVVHELAHAVVWDQHGIESHDHGREFKKACHKMTMKVSGASMKKACSAH